MLGLTCLWQGDFVRAQANLVEALRILDPEREPEARLRYALDVGASARAALAITKWLLGEIGPARALIEQAIETDHITTLVHSYMWKAQFEVVRGDAGAARGDAAIVVKLSQENALPLYLGGGALVSAWASARLDGREAGATQLRQALALAASTGQGVKFLVPFLRGLVAEIEAEDDAAGALTRIEEALALATETGEHWNDAFLHRLRGEILLKRDPANTTAAEQAFLAAIATAQAQNARTFELQAALSLANLYRASGRSAEAHAVLSPAVEGFAPTLEMPQIGEAQALLERLG